MELTLALRTASRGGANGTSAAGGRPVERGWIASDHLESPLSTGGLTHRESPGKNMQSDEQCAEHAERQGDPQQLVRGSNEGVFGGSP